VIHGFVDLVKVLCGVLDLIDAIITLFKTRRRVMMTLSVLTIGALAIWFITRSG
jgi:hypothetical protein